MGTLVSTHLSQNQAVWMQIHLWTRGCIWFQSSLPWYSKLEIEINADAILTILEIVAFEQQVSCHFPINANFWSKPTYNIFDRSMARVIEKFQYISFHFVFRGKKAEHHSSNSNFLTKPSDTWNSHLTGLHSQGKIHLIFYFHLFIIVISCPKKFCPMNFYNFFFFIVYITSFQLQTMWHYAGVKTTT